jgi:hypothetical protein
MSVLACQLIDVLLYLVGNVVIFFSSLYLLRSSFEATSFYIIYLLITHVLQWGKQLKYCVKTRKCYCLNMRNVEDQYLEITMLTTI